MRDHSTLLPATTDDAIAHLRSAAVELAAADQARFDAIAAVREAVMAARVMKVSWDTIGKELGVSRQAAAERFGGDVRTQLVTAWHSIEILLAEIAAARGFRGRPLELLKQLEQEGAVPADVVARALRLHEGRSAAVHTANPEMTLGEAERLTEVAIPLGGILWMLRHADDFNDQGDRPV